jgi:hypothetical protein
VVFWFRCAVHLPAAPHPTWNVGLGVTCTPLAQKKGTVKDVQGLMRHSRTATTTDVYMQEIPESVQSTVNSMHMELRKQPLNDRRTVKKKLSAAPVFGGRELKRGLVSVKVFENLTPIDTKRSERGSSVSLI